MKTNSSLLFVFVLGFLALFHLPALKATAQTVNIGVALPLFEDSDDPSKKQLGSEIFDGMRFAISEFNKTSSVQIKADVKDTKRDPNECNNIIKDFGDDSSIACVLGPIFSSELAQVAELGALYKMPIVSPTATGDELAENHNYVFQLNPSYEVRGRLMADYLFKQQFKSNIVVIAEESYGSNFSKPFQEEIKKLGGHIALSLTYDKSAENINDIVDTVLKVIKANDLFINLSNLNLAQREKVLSFGIRSSLADSLMNMKMDVSIYYLFGKNAKKIADTMSIKPYQISNINAKFIQGYIDAIYIPISNPQEINMIVPELFSSGLSFFLAGTGDWNNEKQLDDNKVYLKNLYFESEYFLDENSDNLKVLRNKLSKTKVKLTKNFLFGYDAASLIADIVLKGARTRQEINEALRNTKDFSAIKSRITLDYHGINSELNILMYDDVIKRIDTYKLKKLP